MHVLSRVLLGIVFALGWLIVMDSSLTAQELPGESTPGVRESRCTCLCSTCLVRAR